MKMYRLLVLCFVFSLALVGCKKDDPAAAAKALCACHEPVESLKADMKAAAGNTAKLTDIAKRVGSVDQSAADCMQQTVGNIAASLKKDGFKSGLLDAMKTQCPEAEKLYSRFVR